jgi:hypothetical protein
MPTKEDFPTALGYASASWLLLCEEKAIRAVGKVEAGPQGAFLDSGEPVMLFERHKFHALTGGRFDKAAPSISDPTPGGYGAYDEQPARLQLAAKYDHDAAILSTSWGLFQILGMNHTAAGFPDLQRFVNAMYRSADDHLRAFTMFIRSNPFLVDALRNKDWRAFAYYYNGPGFAVNQYDVKIRDAYGAL